MIIDRDSIVVLDTPVQHTSTIPVDSGMKMNLVLVNEQRVVNPPT